MFHHHHRDTPDSPVEPSRRATVRLLQGPEELQAAVERAREFERRRANEYQRRIGSYDRFLSQDAGHPTVALPIDTTAEAS
jgi:hypothetical protein